MSLQIENPFLVTGYASPAYFCDREKESKDILETLRNGRNVTLTSPRRLGKTGLIKHIFYILKQKNPGLPVIYIDLFPTTTLAEFTQACASAIMGQLDSSPVKALKKATSIFKGLRPYFTVDPISGQPKVGLDIAAGTEADTLEQVFEYLKHSDKTCYIAFDEFQQIAFYPEKNVEALIRSHIQDLHNVHFIFSGSQSHMLGEMFLSPKRPFYQSTSEKRIDVIDKEVYFNFAASLFKKQGRTLPEDVFSFVYSLYEGYTWYIQVVMNRLYAKSQRALTSGLVQECISEILSENDFYYQYLLRAYSKGQAKLLKAVAKEGKIKEITSGAFISKYSLTATSSVKSALRKMQEEEMIYSSPDGHMIYDRFFAQWLAAKY